MRFIIIVLCFVVTIFISFAGFACERTNPIDAVKELIRLAQVGDAKAQYELSDEFGKFFLRCIPSPEELKKQKVLSTFADEEHLTIEISGFASQ